MAIYRLRGDLLDSWGLYPVFEQRVIAFAEKYGLAANSDVLRQELRARFHNWPINSGYWLFTSDDETRAVTGHICGWLTGNCGILSTFMLEQEGQFTPEQLHEWARLYGLWLDEINNSRGRVPYIMNAPLVTKGEFVTPHPGDTWSRYLRRLGFETRTMQVVKFERRLEPFSASDEERRPEGLAN